MKRRYSHLGPVAQPHGMPLSRETIVTLWKARAMLGWALIARHCGIGRSTLYRMLEGGNGHADTRSSIEGFAKTWKHADDATIASLMRRWSPKRRAA